MANYFLSDSIEAIGPYSSEQLVKMGIIGDTAVREGVEGPWRRADEVDELLPAIAARAEAAAAPSEVASAEVGATAAMRWAPVKDDGYIKPGFRKYSAQLLDIPWGDDWAKACWAMPNTIKGHYFAKPTNCVNNFGMWGEWHVPDAGFGDNFNALVFLVPEFPIQLGHIGWAFRLDDGRWCWGATENNAAGVDPGKPNGVFIERGTREQMMACFRDGVRKDGQGKGWKYFSYKTLRANNPRAARGEQFAEATKNMGYNVLGNNCMTHAIMILNEYAGYPIVPLPVLVPYQMIPRVWFTTINARELAAAQNFWEVQAATAAE